jgi:hypothetical protein
MSRRERNKTGVGNIHLRSEFLHERENFVLVVAQNGNHLHPGDKSLERLDCHRVILEQMTGFSDDRFTSKNFGRKPRQGGASPPMMTIVRIDRGDQRACINENDAP